MIFSTMPPILSLDNNTLMSGLTLLILGSIITYMRGIKKDTTYLREKSIEHSVKFTNVDSRIDSHEESDKEIHREVFTKIEKVHTRIDDFIKLK